MERRVISNSARLVTVTPWFPNRPGEREGNYIFDSVSAVADAGWSTSVLVARSYRPPCRGTVEKWRPGILVLTDVKLQDGADAGRPVMIIVNKDTAYFDGYIARTRVQLQASKEISIRLVAEYNDFGKIWSLSPLLTYRLSPFSLFYIGSTLNYADWPTSLPTPNAPQEWKLDRRQYFMKLQYLFQV